MSGHGLKLELPNFEGPLDLLLHLIKVQKIDIYDIPIAQITSQYLTYLQKMKELNLQIAGEYFVMSSTLLRIKSQYLLPRNDFADEEQEEDPREELVKQLLQYSVFKKIAAYFGERSQKRPLLLAKEASVQAGKKIKPLPAGQVSAQELKAAFLLVVKRAKMKQPRSFSLKVKAKPLKDMINFLTKRIGQSKKVSFFACAKQMNNIFDVIGLFLAMLELGKKRKIMIKQSQSFGDLSLERINHD